MRRGSSVTLNDYNPGASFPKSYRQHREQILREQCLLCSAPVMKGQETILAKKKVGSATVPGLAHLKCA